MKKGIMFPSAVELNQMSMNSKLKERINKIAMKIAAKYLSNMASIMIEEAKKGKDELSYKMDTAFTDDINVAASIEKVEITAVYNAIITIILKTLEDNGFNYKAKSNVDKYRTEEFDVSIEISWKKPL